MTPFTPMLQKLRAIQRDFEDIALEAVVENEENIIQLNQAQLYIGRRADNKRIVPRYAAFTIEYKKQVGQPYDRVTLLDKRNFYDSMYVDVQNGQFELGATDRKTRKLVTKYGERILGLTPESIEVMTQILRPTMMRIILTRLR